MLVMDLGDDMWAEFIIVLGCIPDSKCKPEIQIHLKPILCVLLL